MVDRLFGHHLTHIGTSGRITDHCGTAADQSDRFVACHLETFHQAECHKVSDMKAVCGRVEANVENGLSVVYEFFDLFFIGYLGDQTAGN